MKLPSATIIVAGLLLVASPAFAAPQWVETACWRAAQRVSPILTEPEKEQYIVHSRLDGWNAPAAR
jgi:hypothetical protein